MKGTKTVFLIENNAIDIFITERLLEKFSDRVKLFTFSNSSDALNHITKSKISPHYILLSIGYPATEHLNFLERFEKLKIEKEKTSIHVLSTLVLSSDIEKIIGDHKQIGHIEKPLSIEKLLSIFDNSETEVINERVFDTDSVTIDMKGE